MQGVPVWFERSFFADLLFDQISIFRREIVKALNVRCMPQKATALASDSDRGDLMAIDGDIKR